MREGSARARAFARNSLVPKLHLGTHLSRQLHCLSPRRWRSQVQLGNEGDHSHLNEDEQEDEDEHEHEHEHEHEDERFDIPVFSLNYRLSTSERPRMSHVTCHTSQAASPLNCGQYGGEGNIFSCFAKFV